MFSEKGKSSQSCRGNVWGRLLLAVTLGPLASFLKASILSPHPQGALILGPFTYLVTHSTSPTSRVSPLLPQLRAAVIPPLPLGQSLFPLPAGLPLVVRRSAISSPTCVLSVISGPARPLASPLPWKIPPQSLSPGPPLALSVTQALPSQTTLNIRPGPNLALLVISDPAPHGDRLLS